MTGIIVKSSGGLYTVLCGGTFYPCRARGAFRHRRSSPLVGDRCEFSVDDKLGYVINAILPRKNELIRPAISNIDALVVVFAARSPAPDTLYIDKLLCTATYKKIRPVVVITKSDVDKDGAENLARTYLTTGADVFITSSKNGDGVSKLREFILGQNGLTYAFVGASGVGKSSLLNALFPALSLKTGEISQKIERGKHTTRSVSLFELSKISGGDGFIADTPGFSMLDFVNFNFFPLQALESTFPEFETLVGKCRWHDCTHTKEDGCAVKAALKNGYVAPSRYESYLSLYDELSKKKEWEI